ncbi:MAG: hypothetical protein HRU12_23640, partial [Phaeodactylibacter sp.]|nr:hypothetical protein [Phaeodactylibacter sp.]
MSSLEDFNSTPAVSLEDLEPIKGERTPLGNSASLSNIAAHTAVLDVGQDIEGTYRAVSSELSLDGASATGNKIVEGIRANQDRITNEAMLDYMSDPDISMDDKIKIYENFSAQRANPLGVADLVMTEAVM